MRIKLAAILGLAWLVAMSGCLEEPDIEETWTLVEFVTMSPRPEESVAGTQSVPVRVRGRITYRRILTGFLVAEVRHASTLPPSSVTLTPDEPTLLGAQSVDLILANSVTAGRATRAVTGFDHLMQDVDLSFTAQVPAPMTGGLYLVIYMGSGDEVELSTGEDSLVVTPFVSTRQEVLHTGFALNVTP